MIGLECIIRYKKRFKQAVLVVVFILVGISSAFPQNSISSYDYNRIAHDLIMNGQLYKAINIYQKEYEISQDQCLKKRLDLLLNLRELIKSAKDLNIGGLPFETLPDLEMKQECSSSSSAFKDMDFTKYDILRLDYICLYDFNRFDGKRIKEFVRRGGILIIQDAFIGGFLVSTNEKCVANYDMFGLDIVFSDKSPQSCCRPYLYKIADTDHPAFRHFCKEKIKLGGIDKVTISGNAWNVPLVWDLKKLPCFFEGKYGKGHYIFILQNDRCHKWHQCSSDVLWALLGETAYLLELALNVQE